MWDAAAPLPLPALATPEANIPDYQKEVLVQITDRDTVVSRSLTGKPARVVRASWAEAHERGDAVALLDGITTLPGVTASRGGGR